MGQIGAVLNWEIRLRKAQDILEAYEGATSAMSTASGEQVLSKIYNFIISRDRQAQDELQANNNAETGKFEALDYTKSREIEGDFSNATKAVNGIPVLTEVINLEKIPVLTEVVDKNEIPTLTRVVRDPIHQQYPLRKKVSTESLSHDQEALRRRIDNYFSKAEEAAVARAEKMAIPSNILNKIGEVWNKVPFDLRFLTSGLITAPKVEGVRRIALAVGLSIVMASFLHGDVNDLTVHPIINKLESVRFYQRSHPLCTQKLL